MELEPEEACCVCYEEMQEDSNLSFCKFGCGRNLHTECMERWVKHKIQNAQEVSCPLCRKDWGKNALEELKNNTKMHKEMKKQKQIDARKKTKQPPTANEKLK